jgi:hypothetical protein
MPQNAPKDEKWLLRRIAELEKRIKALETAPRSGNASVSYGKFVILDGETGNQLFRIGYLGEGDDGGVRGVEIFRPSGELAFSTWTGESGDTGNFWSFFDKAGHIVASDDIVSGQGLARPVIGAPVFAPADSSKWVSTSKDDGYDDMWGARWVKQHPRLVVDLWTKTDSGTSGIFRVSCNGVSVTQSVGSGDDSTHILDLTPPGDYGDELMVLIEAQVTGGSGSVRCWPIGVWGAGSL